MYAVSSNQSLRVEKLLNQLNSDINNDNQEILYFGYGSNLSLSNFTQFKNIQLISHCRGIIYDWKLSFSLVYPTKSFANIHYSKGDQVHGIIMKMKKKYLNLLQKLEISYRLITLKAYSYENKHKKLNVYTFIFDKQCENRIKKEIKYNKNIKQVMRFFDINGGGKKPEKNYLNTIINGAKELKLDINYIKIIQQFECIPILKYNPTNIQIKQINNKIWNINDIKKYILENPLECISIFKGIVFDMNQYPPSWKKLANGHDMTMIYAKRWAYANKNNCKSIYTLENEQKLYINGELQKLFNGVYNVKILGKMNKNTHKYDW